MRPGGGHSKGAAFERQTCRELSLWLSEGKNDDLLWRSAMSGGRATVQFKKGRPNRFQAGDMSAISALGEKLTERFLIECKCYGDLQMIGLYLGLKTGIYKHWNETLDDAAKHQRWPMLVARQSRTPTFLLLSRDGINFFDLQKQVLAYFQVPAVYVLWFGDFLIHARRP